MGISSPLIQSWPVVLGGTGLLVAVVGFLAIPLSSQLGLQWVKRRVPVFIWVGLLLVLIGVAQMFMALNRLAN